MLPPGRFHIDCQRSILDTADVLLDGTQLPGNHETILEERGRDGGSQDGMQAGKESPEGIEDRHDLRGMSKPMCRNRSPDQWQGEVTFTG